MPETMTIAAETPNGREASLADYVRIARFDHATKHVFILPGVCLAFLLRPGQDGSAILFDMFVGLLAAVALASANYVINEWLDRKFDLFHPEKSQRAAVQREMRRDLVLLEYGALLVVGLALASQVNDLFLAIAALFAVSGVTYNVEPARTKDVPYLDVLTESINNPLRLCMGWAMVDPFSLPPASVLLAFWFGGAFLMNAKRLAEYRDIVAADGAAALRLYRRSFKYYDEQRLSAANLAYALLCSFFLAVFLIKYRIEYIVLFPCVVTLFVVYYNLALTTNSVARKPEKLFRDVRLVTVSAATGAVFLLLTLHDLPFLDRFAEQHYISVSAPSVLTAPQ